MSKCPITLFYSFQNHRKIYIFLSLFLGILLLISHYFLQKYLFMRPCEQCVYIRFAMVIIIIACFIAFINPKNDFLKSLFYVFAFFGIYYGINASLKLDDIYEAVKNQNAFGLSCKQIPIFPFNIELDKYFSFFKITGECGNDIAYVPKEEISNLSSLQKFFIGNPNEFKDGIYSDGWYLLPWFDFINMAKFSLMVFCFCFFVVFLGFFAFIFKAKKFYSVFVVLASFLLIFLI